ncbi:MAG: hypothetical protein ACYC4Q_09935 [Victivallaceae bacterium]
MKKKSFFSVFEVVLIAGVGAYIAIGLVAYHNPDVFAAGLAQAAKTVNKLFLT